METYKDEIGEIMPVPIGLVGGGISQQPSNNGLLDASFLVHNIPAEDDGINVVASNKNADDLMKIWLNAKRIGNDTLELKGLDIDNRDLIRLKARGLITGGMDTVKLTQKGKSVVSTMSLGESNAFLKKKKNKSYTEILASMDKRNKKGYRIPKFAATNNLINLKDI